MTKPEFVSCKVSTAKTWTVTFTHGWASITVGLETGDVHVQSDWLDGQYTWNPNGLGDRTLFEFLTERKDFGYLCEKLFGREERRLNLTASIKNAKAAILRSRRRGRITKDEAESAWNDVEHWNPDQGHPDMWFSEETFDAFNDSDPSEFLVYEPDPHYTLMRQIVLPTLTRSMKENP